MPKSFGVIESFHYKGEGPLAKKLEINGVDLLKEARPFGGVVGATFSLDASSVPSLELYYGHSSPGFRRPVSIIYADGSTWMDAEYFASLPDDEDEPE